MAAQCCRRRRLHQKLAGFGRKACGIWKFSRNLPQPEAGLACGSLWSPLLGVGPGTGAPEGCPGRLGGPVEGEGPALPGRRVGDSPGPRVGLLSSAGPVPFPSSKAPMDNSACGGGAASVTAENPAGVSFPGEVALASGCVWVSWGHGHSRNSSSRSWGLGIQGSRPSCRAVLTGSLPRRDVLFVRAACGAGSTLMTSS